MQNFFLLAVNEFRVDRLTKLRLLEAQELNTKNSVDRVLMDAANEHQECVMWAEGKIERLKEIIKNK